MRLYLAGRVNARYPFLATVLLLGVQGAILSLIEGWHAGQAIPEAPEPEEEVLVSRGKPGSRPEDLAGTPAQFYGGTDPYGFTKGRGGW